MVDSLGSPIPFSTILTQDHAQGTHSDINGQFILRVAQLPVSLEITSVGYEKKELTIAKPVSKEITIVLGEKETLLREVVVTDAKAKPKMIGSPKSRGRYLYTAEKPFEQVGLMIKNDNNQLYAHPKWLTISVKIFGGKILGIVPFANKPTGERQLRLRIYSIDDRGGIGEDVLASNIFLSPKKAGWYKADISHLTLSLPQKGFVVAIEWLNNQPIRHWKNSDYNGVYGVGIWGYRLSEEDKKYYSSFLFHPLPTGWKKDEGWGEKNGVGILYIPCIRLEFIEL